jgi:GDP-L-fucose synthase
MVGSAIMRRLESENCELLTIDRSTVDLTNQAATIAWLRDSRPDAVFVASAKVGGILANDSYPADFLYQNLMIEANIIEAARQANVSKLLFLGSSCIYPKFAPQPITEEALLTGPLEPTNEWYAIAKIAGIKLCQAYRKQFGCDFISAMPTNLYGPGDNFDLNTSHVIPALMRKTHEAKLRGEKGVEIWGTGTPRREFLHVEDCADACVHLMKHYSSDLHINVGSGTDVTIREVAELICDVISFQGALVFDRSKPDGTPRKLMSIARIQAMGWRPHIGLQEGLRSTYSWFRSRSEAAAA